MLRQSPISLFLIFPMVFQPYHQDNLSSSLKILIVNLLLRHIDATSGIILINGIDIKEYDIESLRDIFAYTPQKTLLFKGSIKENLSFGNKYKLADLDEAMNSADIFDFIEKNEEKAVFIVGLFLY